MPVAVVRLKVTVVGSSRSRRTELPPVNACTYRPVRRGPFRVADGSWNGDTIGRISAYPERDKCTDAALIPVDQSLISARTGIINLFVG